MQLSRFTKKAFAQQASGLGNHSNDDSILYPDNSYAFQPPPHPALNTTYVVIHILVVSLHFTLIIQKTTSHPIVQTIVFRLYNAPASFNNSGRFPLVACRSEFPPICFFAMKMFGTERWPVIPSRASWSAEPSSGLHKVSQSQDVEAATHVLG